MLRFIGGSDCWRALLWSSGLTRLVAANDSFSSGLSSVAVLPIFLISAPVNPVNALLRSDAATKRAFPR
jgi:hypothetical protein